MPALKQRKEDIRLLTDHFITHYNNEVNKKITTVSEDLRNTLQIYDWPGNIRELRSTIERAMILSEGEELNKKYIRK